MKEHCVRCLSLGLSLGLTLSLLSACSTHASSPEEACRANFGEEMNNALSTCLENQQLIEQIEIRIQEVRAHQERRIQEQYLLAQKGIIQSGDPEYPSTSY